MESLPPTMSLLYLVWTSQVFSLTVYYAWEQPALIASYQDDRNYPEKDLFHSYPCIAVLPHKRKKLHNLSNQLKKKKGGGAWKEWHAPRKYLQFLRLNIQALYYIFASSTCSIEFQLQ